MKSLRLTSAALVLAIAPLPFLLAQEHDHSPQPTAAQIATSRRQFSPELQKMKSLAGRWEGTTTRESEGTNPAVVTYSITGAGSAVVETLFPGTAREMTTIYHDDSKGRLTADHYCTASNQPKLRMIQAKDGRLEFELSPDSDLKADIEGHAHNLTLIFDEDGSLQHEWLNHYMGKPAEERNIKLTKVK